MSTQPKKYLTPEQYLEIEEKAECRSEYFRGEMFAMAGARRAHNLISGNAFYQLRHQLRQSPWEVYQNDMRVRVSATGLYTYPDVVVACASLFLNEQESTLGYLPVPMRPTSAEKEGSPPLVVEQGAGRVTAFGISRFKLGTVSHTKTCTREFIRNSRLPPFSAAGHLTESKGFNSRSAGVMRLQ